MHRRGPMLEIRFHGRGGQGSVVASEIFARAAFVEGKTVQSFPYFGVERRGAPVTAFTRIDDSPILNRSSIYVPDVVVVLDPSLLKSVDITVGLKPQGMILANWEGGPQELPLAFKGTRATVDATSIALSLGLGNRATPLVNTAMVGALSRLLGFPEMDSLVSAIHEEVPQKAEENCEAARRAYRSVEVLKVLTA